MEQEQAHWQRTKAKAQFNELYHKMVKVTVDPIADEKLCGPMPMHFVKSDGKGILVRTVPPSWERDKVLQGDWIVAVNNMN